MSEAKPDEFHGQGGTYVMKDGKRVRVGEPARDHPEGNRARDKDGNPLPSLPLEEGGGSGKGSGNVKPIRGGKPAPIDE